MGRRIPRPPTTDTATRLINSVQQQGRELTHINPFRGGQVTRVTRFLSAGGRAAGVAAEIGGDEAAVAGGEAAGEALVGLGAWPFILLFIAVLVVLRLLEGVLLFLVGSIPLFGSRVQPAIRAAFHWLDDFENWVMTYIEDQIRGMLTDAVTLVGWCLHKLGFDIPGQGPAPRATPGQVATESEVAALRAQVARQQVEINTINHVLSNPSNLPGPAASPAPVVTNVTDVTRTVVVGVPQNLWDQIHALHATQAAFQRDLNEISNTADHALSTATSALHQAQDLSHEVHAIRAVTVGYQEIQQELENIGGLMTSFIDETAAELQRQDRVQRQMAPLGLLLSPGLPGLRNLRTLEDNMCQCPRIPRLPGLTPELLAMYEFVTHG